MERPIAAGEIERLHPDARAIGVLSRSLGHYRLSFRMQDSKEIPVMSAKPTSRFRKAPRERSRSGLKGTQLWRFEKTPGGLLFAWGVDYNPRPSLQRLIFPLRVGGGAGGRRAPSKMARGTASTIQSTRKGPIRSRAALSAPRSAALPSAGRSPRLVS